jgi:hypothetical protein
MLGSRPGSVRTSLYGSRCVRGLGLELTEMTPVAVSSGGVFPGCVSFGAQETISSKAVIRNKTVNFFIVNPPLQIK